jgi:hypothetical protein
MLQWIPIVFTFACAPEDEGDETPLGATGYLAASWVTDAESTNTYVAVVDSLEIEEIDFANAIEVPGWADAWVYEDWVFVAEGEAPNVRRYSVDEDGRLALDLEMGFANTGVYGAAFWDQQILSPTKAYLSNAGNREYVVWNPSTMEITGTVPWPPELDFEEGLEPFHSYTDRGGVVVDGLLFHSIYGHDKGFTYFGDKSYMLVYDIETDELVDTIELPCPMMDTATLGDDGYLYASGWSYMPLSYEAGYSDTNCAVRIDVATRVLDTAWTFDYASATGGAQGSGLRAISGNDGIFAAFHGTGIEAVPGMDIWELDAGENDWELYSLALEDKVATPTGIEMSDGSYYESHVGERYFVYLPGLTHTQVYERTANGFVPGLKAKGWMSRLFELR